MTASRAVTVCHLSPATASRGDASQSETGYRLDLQRPDTRRVILEGRRESQQSSFSPSAAAPSEDEDDG